MSTFGEELRTQRISRGIALEQITAVTKISQRHLVALEQDRFQQLPGGILSKGIVRGYVGAIGLDPHDWTDRFLKATCEKGAPVEPAADGWATFASNVGKERMERRDAMEQRLRWLGAAALVALVTVLGLYHRPLLRRTCRLVDFDHPSPAESQRRVSHVASWMRHF